MFSQKQNRIDTLKGFLEKHKFHIAKLEAILRLVDNDAIDIEEVKTELVKSLKNDFIRHKSD